MHRQHVSGFQGLLPFVNFLGHMSKGGLRLFGSPIEKVDDDLYLGAIVLESKGVTLCLIACDLGNSRTEEALEIRSRVADAL